MGPPLQKINYLHDRNLVLGGFENHQWEGTFGKRYNLFPVLFIEVPKQSLGCQSRSQAGAWEREIKAAAPAVVGKRFGGHATIRADCQHQILVFAES